VDFQLAASSSSVSVSAPGQSATATLTVTPLDGFSQTVSYSCAGLPSEAACSFANTATGATLKITTTAATSARLQRSSGQGGGPLLALLLPGLLGLFTTRTWRRRSRAILTLVLVAVLGLGFLCVGCSGSSGTGGGGGNLGTPAGTSSVTVTATAGSLSHQTTINFTVQ
jgi:hypothetical protein